jgi:DNA-binding NarL/FixJ family response regulator
VTNGDALTCVIADDHPPVLHFLARHLTNNGITVAASTRDGEEALRKIEHTQPTFALLDARMPRLTGVEVTRRLAESGSRTPVILYTGHGDQDLVSAALDVGVRGVIDKGSPVDDLVRAIRIVADGGTYVDASSSAALLVKRNETSLSLSRRERDVLRLLAGGYTNDAIGAMLTISPQTVRTHVQKAMQKLGATTRIQAVAIAVRESLIS